MAHRTLFVLLVLLALTELEALCSQPVTDGINVSIRSYRNQTGHWISQIGLGQNEINNDSSIGWLLNVKQEKTTCQDKAFSRHISVTLTEPPPRAGPGYILYPDLGYYKFHPPRTMASGKQVCESEGAHLVIVNSESEAALMQQLLVQHVGSGNSYSWVGVIERGDSAYVTIFGASFNSTGFTGWDKVHGEPNGKGTDDCIVIASYSGGFHDTPCTGTSYFICEQELW